MKLIVGLGNPGKRYEPTWHNVGFLALDKFKSSKDDAFLNYKCSKKFQAQICEGSYLAEKIILAKPQTFMNLSGQAVKAISTFYKIKPEDIWLIHDDLDLPLGQIRISHNASAAGHKGVQSVIDEIGTKNFVRFRIGIKTETPKKIPAQDFVLQKIDKKCNLLIEQTINEIVSALETALTQGVTEAKNDFN
ncbi:MAG: aminoacyl-tRNA hydrolase [Candidatus Buchananbacteria bacterium]